MLDIFVVVLNRPKAVPRILQFTEDNFLAITPYFKDIFSQFIDASSMVFNEINSPVSNYKMLSWFFEKRNYIKLSNQYPE